MRRAGLIIFALSAALAQMVRAEPIAPSALDNLPPSDVVVLGEVHDNPAHHANQARAVAALNPAAIVFEMMTPAQARAVTPRLRDDPGTLAAALGWAESGWPDFALYYPIIAAAPKAEILGAQVPRAELRQVISRRDPAGVFGSDARKFGLTRPLPGDQQSRREKMQARAHCGALPEEMLPGMVMGQRLRDAALARAALRALQETGGPVVVITGNGHARADWGVPAILKEVAPKLRVLSVGQFEAPPAPPVPHDLWLVTAPVARDDPCAGLAGAAQP